MNRVLDSLRFLIVAPENLAVLAVGALWLHTPSPFEALGRRIATSELSSGNLFIWVSGSSVAAAALLSWKVVAPLDSNAALVRSPIWDGLKARVMYACCWPVISTVVAFLGVVANSLPSQSFLGAAFIGAVSAAWISCATLFIASLEVRAILERFGK